MGANFKAGDKTMIFPLTAQDSQLHMAITFYRKGWVSKKEFLKAVKELQKDWKEAKYGRN